MNGSAENPSHVMLDFAVHDESVSRDLISEAGKFIYHPELFLEYH